MTAKRPRPPPAPEDPRCYSPEFSTEQLSGADEIETLCGVFARKRKGRPPPRERRLMLLTSEHRPMRAPYAREQRSAPFLLIAISAAGVAYEIRVTGLQLSFLVAVPGHGDGVDEDLACYDVRHAIKKATRRGGRPDWSCAAVRGRGLFGYGEAHGRDRLMVRVSSPASYFLKDAVEGLRALIRMDWPSAGIEGAPVELFDTDIEPLTQLCVSAGLKHMAWFETDTTTAAWEPRPGMAGYRMGSCPAASIRVLDPDAPENMAVAPLRILSFDIEAAATRGVFPKPDTHPAIIIAASVGNFGGSPGVEAPASGHVAFAFGSALRDNLEGPCLRFPTEAGMLDAWRRFFLAYDPDIVTGWNTNGFDWPFLVGRAKTLSVPACNALGRLSTSRDVRCWEKERGKSGFVERNVAIGGRVIYDMMGWCEKNMKLRSYTLNSVSSLVLDQTKEDVHYSHIHPMWAVPGADGDAGRRRLISYCMKDAKLPLIIMTKKQSLPASVELARLTGVSMGDLVSRGQEIMSLTKLLHEIRGSGLVLPDRAVRIMGAYEGALVLDPRCGFYRVEGGYILLLDFKSLYPTIIWAHNCRWGPSSPRLTWFFLKRSVPCTDPSHAPATTR